MALSNGTKLGPYEILAPAGAGGMGEVYRARDTRLDREVAVKILPATMSDNADIRERFEREARAVSKLSHPNICILHDVGREGGVDFIVMEYLEGETLEKRLEKGPLPPEQILKYACQIADALDKAHRQGIIHRDMKPANIMLTKAGAKLMDFGLAKQLEAVPVAAALTELTATDRKLTTEGTILGTFQYMAPEQLEGQDADQRTDIFAFGEVLYEMATAQPPFKGRTKASLIASILSSEPPPIATLQPLTPPGLDRVVKICLAKDPAERFQSAHDLKLQLEWIAEGGSQAGVPAPIAARRKHREWIAWSAAAVLAVIAALSGWFLHRPTVPQLMRATVSLPANMQLTNEGSLVLSPDGRKLAIAGGADGKLQIFIRSLDSTALQPLAGSDGATYPFWSPDSQYVGFFADGKLKKVPAEGGTVQVICDAADGRGASWSVDDVIAFSPGPYEGIYTVSAAGGTRSELTKVEGQSAGVSHRVPFFLPDGQHVLYFTLSAGGATAEEGVYAVSLKDKKSTKLLSERSAAIYADPGYLLFIRDGNLLAQRFDPASLKLSGDATPIAEDVQFNAIRRTGTFTTATNGVLVYQTGAQGGKAQMNWYDVLTGKDLGKVGTPGGYQTVDLAPDSKKAIARIGDPQSGAVELWEYDLARDVFTRLTFSGTTIGVAWAPDSSKVAYGLNRAGTWTIVEKPINGGGGERELVSSAAGAGERTPNSYSWDGKYLAFQQRNLTNRSWDIWMLPLSGDQRAYPFVASTANETNGNFSPDGKWFTYTSDESGRLETYVVPFPRPGGKWQVSANGALGGGWDRKGRFGLLAFPLKYFLVPMQAHGDQLEIGKPQPVLGDVDLAHWRSASLTADGDRFLAVVPLEKGGVANLTLVSNWPATLKTKK
jgi:Tol biopolymer transport system component